MLTREAFNALLKTLEEPPEHVKFIFCTTEANKIPVTILSRCQRFDFAGIRAPSIRERLRQIAEAEGVDAEPAALELLARRANGSMRDSQSLLEQLLSFGGRTIRAADVHALLGTAGDARLVQLLEHLVDRDAAAALRDLDAALIEGVDVGQLLEQLLSICRDAMTAAVGCPAESFLYTSPEQQASVAEAGRALGLETILAILQIIDQALARMRYSTQGRTLAETALVRICYLENLDALSSLLSRLQQESEPASPPAGGSRQAAANRPQAASTPERQESPPALVHSDPGSSKKKADLNADSPASRGSPNLLTAENASDVWQKALASLPSGILADSAAGAQHIASSAPNRLVVGFPERYNFQKSLCERPDQLSQLQQAVSEVVGGHVHIELASFAGDSGSKGPVVQQPVKTAATGRQWLAEKSNDPFVVQVSEIFAATAFRADPPAE
jgi:DNA polymerase-3 subunit gamma/tau